MDKKPDFVHPSPPVSQQSGGGCLGWVLFGIIGAALVMLLGGG